MINWQSIDTLLLDMDGTVLDLAFDNYFWLELLPQHIAQRQGISLGAAREIMNAHTARALGSLQWYCIDHWSALLDLDVARIKHGMRHRIAYLPGALPFLAAARAAGLRLIVVTNAHPQTLAIKLRQTHLDRHVDAVYSSHAFGRPKESAEFWQGFEQASGVQRGRAVLIDDSAPVVSAARAQGLAGAVTIARPDSSRPRRTISDGPSIDALGDLLGSLSN